VAASPPGAPGAGGGAAPAVIRVEHGLVTVRVAGLGLEEVVTAIAAQAGMTVVLDGPHPETISADLRSVPLDEALSRLIAGNFVLVYSAGPGGRVIEVRIFGLGSPIATEPAAHRERPRPGAPRDVLIQALRDGDAEERGRAVVALGKRRDQAAVEAVVAALGDEDAGVRQRAVWALRDLGGPRAIDALAEAVAADTEPSIRLRAADSLVVIGGQEAIESLSQALRYDPHPFVRYTALAGLASVSGDGATDLLVQALQDPSEMVRAQARELLDMRAGDGAAPSSPRSGTPAQQ
jgi:hypothetical protein